MAKKILSLALALVMMVTTLSFTAMAENDVIYPMSVGENNIVYRDGTISGNVKLNVINNTGEAASAIAVTAIFEKATNSFAGATISDNVTLGKGNTVVTAQLPTVTQADGDYVAKIYLWNGKETLVPVAEGLSVDVFETVPVLTGDKDIPEFANGVYQIENANQLAWFSELIAGTATDESDVAVEADADANAILVNDIYINNPVAEDGSFDEAWYENGASGKTNWYSNGIGRTSAYKGVFDGNSKTVYGMYVCGARPVGGLFSSVSGGTVKNVNVNSGYVVSENKNPSKSDYNTGASAMVVGLLSDGTIDGAVASGEITVAGETYSSHLTGGIVANVDGSTAVSTVTNCTSFVDIALGNSAQQTSLPDTNANGLGGIIGGLKTNKTYKSVVTNNTFCGTIDSTKTRVAAGILAWTVSTHLSNVSGNANYGTITLGEFAVTNGRYGHIVASYNYNKDASQQYLTANICEGTFILPEIEEETPTE